MAGSGFDGDSAEPHSEEYWRALIARYWGMVTLVDKAVGTMMQALEDAGVADNTIVVYSSEHGDQLGEHNIIQKAVFYEQSGQGPDAHARPLADRRRDTRPRQVQPHRHRADAAGSGWG